MAEFAGHKAQRTCLGCREVVERSELLRYALSPDRQVLVDYRGKLPGRGAYTCLKGECLAAAVRKGQFQRTFKGTVEGADVANLLGQLQKQIEERILGLVGMARKAGTVVTGGNMVLAALGQAGQLALVLLAEDISSGVGNKIAGKADVVGVPVYKLFDKTTLGRVLGKDERSSVGLKDGALAEAISAELLRQKEFAGEF